MKTKLTILTVAAAISLSGLTTSVLAETEETQAQLQAEAKVSKADAEKTALGKVPNGTVKESELEKEHGKLVWSFDISTPHSKDITEVQVDATTGEIVLVEIKTPKDQAKEKSGEKKEKE